MKISDFLKKECIDVNLKPEGSKRDIFKKLIEIALLSYSDLNEKKIMNGLLKREKLGSTGVGRGIAIPHTGIDTHKNIITVFGLVKNGMEFESLDNLPIKIIFMILFPAKDITLQLRFLARVSRLLRKEELREKLISSDSSGGILDIFESYEKRHFG